jgi:hypothetical protein
MKRKKPKKHFQPMQQLGLPLFRRARKKKIGAAK